MKPEHTKPGQFPDSDRENRNRSLKVYSALFLAILFWGGSFPAIKIVMTGFTPISYVFFRFFGAAFIFGILMIKKFRRLKPSTHVKLALMALFHPTLYFIFESLGLQYTSASSASILVAALPGIVALLARFLLKEKLNVQQWSGVLLSVVGVILLAGFDDNPVYSESSMLGNGLVLLAILSAAVYMIFARHLSSILSAVELTSYQVFYSILYLFPVFLSHSPNVNWESINGASMLALLFLILGATMIAFLSYNYAISCIDVSRAAVFLNGVPVVAIILSSFVLHEGLGLLQLTGGTVVIAGVTLTNVRRRGREVNRRNIVS